MACRQNRCTASSPSGTGSKQTGHASLRAALLLACEQKPGTQMSLCASLANCLTFGAAVVTSATTTLTSVSCTSGGAADIERCEAGKAEAAREPGHQRRVEQQSSGSPPRPGGGANTLAQLQTEDWYNAGSPGPRWDLLCTRAKTYLKKNTIRAI
jgi:hypothetical protein